MKAREIRKVVVETKLVGGWLAVDSHLRGACVVFFPGKTLPNCDDDGDWDTLDPKVNWKNWSLCAWRKTYGVPIPKPSACERVKLEL